MLHNHMLYGFCTESGNRLSSTQAQNVRDGGIEREYVDEMQAGEAPVRTSGLFFVVPRHVMETQEVRRCHTTLQAQHNSICQPSKLSAGLYIHIGVYPFQYIIQINAIKQASYKIVLTTNFPRNKHTHTKPE